MSSFLSSVSAVFVAVGSHSAFEYYCDVVLDENAVEHVIRKSGRCDATWSISRNSVVEKVESGAWVKVKRKETLVLQTYTTKVKCSPSRLCCRGPRCRSKRCCRGWPLVPYALERMWPSLCSEWQRGGSAWDRGRISGLREPCLGAKGKQLPGCHPLADWCLTDNWLVYVGFTAQMSPFQSKCRLIVSNKVYLISITATREPWVRQLLWSCTPVFPFNTLLNMKL